MSNYPSVYNEPESLEHYLERLVDGEPCMHKGCLSHVTHPCELCGRIAGYPPKESKLSSAVKSARGGDDPVRFKGYA